MKGLEMKVLDRIKFEDEKNRVWGNIFAVEYDGRELVLQETEVDAIDKWTVKEVLERIENEKDWKITPDGKLAFLQFLKLGVI